MLGGDPDDGGDPEDVVDSGALIIINIHEVEQGPLWMPIPHVHTPHVHGTTRNVHFRLGNTSLPLLLFLIFKIFFLITLETWSHLQSHTVHRLGELTRVSALKCTLLYSLVAINVASSLIITVFSTKSVISFYRKE